MDMDMPSNLGGSGGMMNEAGRRRTTRYVSNRRGLRSRRRRSAHYSDLDTDYEDHDRHGDDMSNVYAEREGIDCDDQAPIEKPKCHWCIFDCSWFYSVIQFIVVIVMQLLTRAAINSFLRG